MIKYIKFISVLLVFGGMLVPSLSAQKNSTPKKANISISFEEQRKLDYYFYEAVRQRHLGNLDQAIDLLTECFYINPNSPAVAYEFGMIYTSIQDVPSALSFMRLASNLDSKNSWYKMATAELCLKNSDLPGAIEVYEDIAKNHPEKEDVDYMLASLYGQTGNLKKSLEALNKAEKRFGVNEIISFEKYRVHTAMGQHKKADQEIDRLIEKYPLEARYKLLRSSLYLEKNKPKQALKLLDEVRIMEPHNTMLITSLYEYYKSTGDTVKADAVFADTFENKDIKIEDKLTVLTQFLSQENQSVEKAEIYLKSLVNQYPDNEILRGYYTSFLLMQRRMDEAVPQLEEMLKINPKNQEGWYELIRLRVGQAEWGKTIAVTDSALIHFPNNSTIYFFKGIALAQEERYDDAIATYQTGITKVPEEEKKQLADFYLQIGDLYALKKKMPVAFEYYEKGYQMDNNNIGLLNNYAYYLSLEKRDLDKAEAMSSRTVIAEPDNASFLDTYAWIFFIQENFTLARMYIQQAIDKGGDQYSTVIEHYGDILYKIGETEEAIKWWKKALIQGSESKTLRKKIETKTYIPE